MQGLYEAADSSSGMSITGNASVRLEDIHLEGHAGTKLMVFLAGPPNRGRGAVLKLTEMPQDVRPESHPGVDSEAGFDSGHGMNGNAHLHQLPQTELQVFSMTFCRVS